MKKLLFLSPIILLATPLIIGLALCVVAASPLIFVYMLYSRTMQYKEYISTKKLKYSCGIKQKPKVQPDLYRELMERKSNDSTKTV